MLAEQGLRLLARLGGESPTAWWIVLLTVGPILGSFITEPAAMTICAMLLSRKFYAFEAGRDAQLRDPRPALSWRSPWEGH